ncbi:MAG: SUMF1/EgtB/PvdO family nonheme iron enzyme [Bdellovibrio bacteriovorus]
MSQPPEPPEHAASALDLRTALEQMRKEAEREIARLSRKLADREHEAETRVVSATESIALQQELSTLQHALAQKEQALDQITAECRRLEDELEDQHQVFDGLKQEVESKESSLKAAQEEVLRLRQQLAAIQEQSLDLSGPASTGLDGARGVPSGSPTPAQTPVARPSTSVKRYTMGILAGLIVLAVAGVMIAGGGGLHWSPKPHVEGVGQAPIGDDGSAAQARPQGESPPAPAPVVPETTPRPAAQTSPPSQAPRTLSDRLRVGGQGPTLALLPGGAFRMGHNTLGGGDTGPEREVRVAPFGIGVQEVTFDQYDRFARATGRGLPDDFGWGRGNRPVIGVSWSDAQAYVEWLSRQTGQRYRLPSEAEWELAARGGGRGSYWWGFGLEPGRAACFDCGSPFDNRSTAPVGSFPPSAYGLYDTAGNVMEWMADCYHPGYEGAPPDGRARLDEDCRLRVARGGAFNKPSASMRAYARTRLDPSTRLNNLGFRVARDP